MERVSEQSIEIASDGALLDGDLVVPARARGVVLFAHGSGSSRFSPRNRFVAERLHAGGLATLLLDLLTPDEERLDEVTSELRFDIGLLARRLVDATEWLAAAEETRRLPIGYFGSSTGAAAALVAAAELPNVIAAVVSRGGRVDLAGAELPRVVAPTLLLVGSEDEPVLEWNRDALPALGGYRRLEIIRGASHLFTEAGALSTVARFARDFFVEHFPSPDLSFEVPAP